MTNWKPKRKQREKTCGNISYLPFINIEDGSNLLFITDTDEWTLAEVSDWFNRISNCFANVNIAILPKNMTNKPVSITDKEYTVINNILKRMKE